MILDKQHQAREFLAPLPEEDRLSEELLGHLKGQGRPTNAADPLTNASTVCRRIYLRLWSRVC